MDPNRLMPVDDLLLGHLMSLIAGGMTVYKIAAVSGISYGTIHDIHAGRRHRVRGRIAQALLGITPATPTPRMVMVTGTSRRLQALAVAGYSLPTLAPRTKVRRWQLLVWRWPFPRQLLTRNYQKVRDVYEDLWDTEGPSDRANAQALKHGWQPFEAWTDENIDDPNTAPWQAAHASIDLVLLDRVRNRTPGPNGKVPPFMTLSEAERLVLWREHRDAGRSLRSFSDRYRPIPIDILRELETLV